MIASGLVIDAWVCDNVDVSLPLKIVEPSGFTETNRLLPVLNPRGPCDDL
jgi:hypothetical protein